MKCYYCGQTLTKDEELLNEQNPIKSRNPSLCYLACFKCRNQASLVLAKLTKRMKGE